jgi:hypothetical protein
LLAAVGSWDLAIFFQSMGGDSAKSTSGAFCSDEQPARTKAHVHKTARLN